MKPIITIISVTMLLLLPIVAFPQTVKDGNVTISASMLIQLLVYLIGIVSFIIMLKYNTKQNNERLDKHEALFCGTDQKIARLETSIDEKFKVFVTSIEKSWHSEFLLRDKDLSNRIDLTKTDSEHKLEILSTRISTYQEMIEKLINQINLRNEQIVKDQNEIFEKLNELSINLGKTCQHHPSKQ